MRFKSSRHKCSGSGGLTCDNHMAFGAERQVAGCGQNPDGCWGAMGWKSPLRALGGLYGQP